MGLKEDLQKDNEEKFGKKNFSDTYDSSKMKTTTPTPTPSPSTSQNESKSWLGNSLQEDATEAFKRKLETLKGSQD